MKSDEGVVAAADRFQGGHRWVAFPLAVAYKYVDDQGGFLAALITYYGFLSLFPGLLLLVTTLGYVLSGNPDAQQRVLDTALGNFPVIGQQLQVNPSSVEGNAVAVVVGVLLLLYGVIGIGQAVQLAFNRTWAVPRNERPNPLQSRLRSVGLVLLIGVGLMVTTSLTGIAAASGGLEAHVSALVRLLLLVAAVLTNVALFVAAFRLLTAKEIGARDLLPGALFAAACWQALQTLGTTYVSRVVTRSSDIYGVFGVVLGLLAWIYLAAVVSVI